MLQSTVSRAASTNWNADWPDSIAEVVRRSIQSVINNLDHDVSADGLAEALARDAPLIRGIAAYRRHDWRRCLSDPPEIWAEGGSRLLDYGTESTQTAILFVPSLINRAYVLDLTARSSMMRWFATQGIRPLLMDWGWPGATERRFSLTDYVAGRLERSISAAVKTVGNAVILAGYCMGGTLALSAAQRRPDLIRGLALLATPWDFHAPDRSRALQAAAMLPMLEPALGLMHAMPVDILQALFTLPDPWSVAEKYRRFGRLDQASPQAQHFVALEDWLNDGVPLAANVARACLGEWYGENAPACGTWTIAGLAVDPSSVKMPTFVAVPARDRIVSPESALPLATLIPGAALHRPNSGHIGMAAGARAEQDLWRPMLAWLQKAF